MPMARLTALQPRLRAVGARIAAPLARPEAEAQRHRDRDRAQPWRAWYKTARWQALKIEVHVRDNFTCQKTGIILTGKHPAPNSPVADHKIPHHGDEALFWDKNNIQTVSKAYHDSVKQAEERAQARW
jgi:5-methylcytosine-specific restriction endonuclease McrA